jgi:hypothetical protein
METKPFRPLPSSPSPRSTETDVSTTADFTAFAPNKGEKGKSFYASKPNILCCETALAQGETAVFEYVEKLPYHLPPTYKGHCVRYMYKVTLGIQCFGPSGTRHVRLPFRVMTLEGLQDNMRSLQHSVSEEEGITPSSNPFLRNIQPKVRVLETGRCRD